MRDTRTHWYYFKPVTDKSDEFYHFAGADKSLWDPRESLDNRTLMQYLYRFWFEEWLLKLIVRVFVKKRRLRALDAGCGTGRNAVVLSEYFETVDAFDISQTFIDENKKRFNSIGNVSFFELDVSDIRELKEQYDLVLLGGLLMYLTDDESARLLGYLKEVLNPSGVLVARDTLSREKTEYADQIKVYRSLSDYGQLFDSAGFKLKSMFNGPNRNIFVSIFSQLPKIIQEQRWAFKFFMRLALSATASDIARATKQPFRRHRRANQLFYVYGPNL